MRPDRHHAPLLVFSDEVADALAADAPVVALESNVITHGLTYPDNAATARRVESAVRAGGAVPATIGIADGRILIGMSEADIERFATSSRIPKVSSRDMPMALATRGMGATTVASSLIAADLAGIAFFASAGIGGVHRGAASTLDISSDLIQFTRSKVAVVCAGAKSILDLGLTLEFLETHCVPVITCGADDFPAFYCVSSGLRSPHRIDDEATIARAIDYHWALGQHSAVLIASPIDACDAIDSREVDAVIASATRAAERDGVRGNALTKYLMHAVDAATAGRSARANMAVLISTAELAGRLAAAHARLAAEVSSLDVTARAARRSVGVDDRAGTKLVVADRTQGRSRATPGRDAMSTHVSANPPVPAAVKMQSSALSPEPERIPVAAIFDLDGTLVDTPRAIVETFTAVFAALDVPPRDPAAIRATIGLPLERAFSQLLERPLDHPFVPRAVAQYQVYFKELVLPRAQSLVFPGVSEGLAALHDRGVCLAVATSKFYASAHALLAAAGLRDLFAVVIGADQVTAPKPAAETGLRILRELGIPAACAVVIGDTTHDLGMARAAGMRSIAVTYGIHAVHELRTAEPTWIADSFGDVVRCVTRGLLSRAEAVA